MPVAVGGAPAVRQPRVPNQPTPWTVGPNAGQGDVRNHYGPPTYLPGTNTAGAPAPSNPGNNYYMTDPSGNFLGGNPEDYARGYAGLFPSGTAGQYSDALSLAERNAAQNNYGAAAAQLDRSEGNIKTTFEEMLSALNRNKSRSTNSLADSMADRGLSNSGIFLGTTNELNENFANQMSGQTRQRDTQLGDIQQNRVNISNALAQALATADQAAYERKLKAWNDAYTEGLRQAQERLARAGVL